MNIFNNLVNGHIVKHYSPTKSATGTRTIADMESKRVARQVVAREADRSIQAIARGQGQAEGTLRAHSADMPDMPADLAEAPAAWSRQRKPRGTEERDFQLAVVDVAKLKGLRYFYIPDSRKCPAGWPDLFVWGPGGALAIENKSRTGTTSDIQNKTHEQLRAAGVQVVIRRPHDLVSGRINADFQRLATPAPTGQRDADIALVMQVLTLVGRGESPAVQAFTRLITPAEPFVPETPQPTVAKRTSTRRRHVP